MGDGTGEVACDQISDGFMLTKQPETLEFLQTRRSRPAKTLTSPAPERDALLPILEAGLRVPDHGKLEPWRLMVLSKAALGRIGQMARVRGAELDFEAERIEKTAIMFEAAPLMVAVISAPVESPKIPEIEQTLSSGAVCLGILNAALASGWGANWLTGPLALDEVFLERALRLDAHESVAGFIVIGTETATPPERPRPDLDLKIEWVHA